MASVRVHMRICEKTHKVTVTMREDGDLDVKIKSDCIKVKEYGEDLKKLTMMDLTNITMSRIMDPQIVEHLTPTCLAPAAVFNAAWLETGLMSKSLAKQVKENSIEFLDD